MAQSVVWSQEALDDIDSIAAYIHRDSPRHAQRVAEEILALGSSIAEQPQIGRIVPEVEDEAIRERFIYSYRVIYEIQPTQVEVVAVIHGRRLLESIADRLP